MYLFNKYGPQYDYDNYITELDQKSFLTWRPTKAKLPVGKMMGWLASAYVAYEILT
jgi:hypothetical protein